ncbi:Heavy metal-associated isoprenylated plant protein 26 [Apostasia shenzhenica]|uniref:Heavy metal-associated isoprenylated plant protein 26 n=1 Tax=Apostasia shenzhenica TaxID=1088818 RepID=A0A2I0AX59_9ASPA|nr:Heavy metal-associated isoprenylated plant protein 26 [Apostasia shenzhenica]
MGVMDKVSDLFSEFAGGVVAAKKRKRKPFQTVEIKVRMDCEGCERKVKQAVEGMKGVTTVEVIGKQNRLTVAGYVDPKKVVATVRRKTGKPAELWPYVPYEMVYHPYVAGAYDKKAPPGYVRNVVDDPRLGPLVRASSTEEKFATAFSDENPNACSVM